MDIITLALAKKIAEEKALAASETKVDKTTTVNGKELSTDIEIEISDIAGLETTINTKADKTYVDNELALKADLVDGVVPVEQLPTDVDGGIW